MQERTTHSDLMVQDFTI